MLSYVQVFPIFRQQNDQEIKQNQMFKKKLYSSVVQNKQNWKTQKLFDQITIIFLDYRALQFQTVLQIWQR